MNKKHLKKGLLLTIGIVGISAIIPISIVSCSNSDNSSDQLNTLKKQFNNWDTLFQKEYDNNFQKVVTTDINTNIDNASKSWNNFVSAYEKEFHTSSINIDWDNFNLYVNSFSLTKNSLTCNNNQTFDLNLTWIFNLSISQNNNKPKNNFNLVINDDLIDATLAPTLIVAWPDVLNSNISAFGGFYINSVNNSKLKVSTSNLNIPENDLKKLDTLEGLLNNLSGSLVNNLTLKNPSSINWVSPSFITPILSYSQLENQLSSFGLISNSDSNKLDLLQEIFTPGIYGTDYSINANGYQYQSVSSNNQTTFENVVDKLKN